MQRAKYNQLVQCSASTARPREDRKDDECAQSGNFSRYEIRKLCPGIQLSNEKVHPRCVADLIRLLAFHAEEVGEQCEIFQGENDSMSGVILPKSDVERRSVRPSLFRGDRGGYIIYLYV